MQKNKDYAAFAGTAQAVVKIPGMVQKTAFIGTLI
jgi:hypothetical protein